MVAGGLILLESLLAKGARPDEDGQRGSRAGNGAVSFPQGIRIRADSVASAKKRIDKGLILKALGEKIGA
jgi:hypothetical protein